MAKVFKRSRAKSDPRQDAVKNDDTSVNRDDHLFPDTDEDNKRIPDDSMNQRRSRDKNNQMYRQKNNQVEFEPMLRTTMEQLELIPEALWEDALVHIAEQHASKIIDVLAEKADETGIDFDVLYEVFYRGWYSNHSPHLSEMECAFNRVNSFISGGLAQRLDNDLITEISKDKLERYVMRSTADWSMSRNSERNTTRENERQYYGNRRRKRSRGQNLAFDKLDKIDRVNEQQLDELVGKGHINRMVDAAKDPITKNRALDLRTMRNNAPKAATDKWNRKKYDNAKSWYRKNTEQARSMKMAAESREPKAIKLFPDKIKDGDLPADYISQYHADKFGKENWAATAHIKDTPSREKAAMLLKIRRERETKSR